MVDVIQNNIEKIKQACIEMQVKSLFLIGSAARQTDFKQSSDLDFVFRFHTNEKGYPVAGYDYFDFLFRLEEITGKKVDLIAEEKIRNRYFLRSINEDKVSIYES